MENIKEYAKKIKEYCSKYGTYHEEECPFFSGYEKVNDIQFVKCKLNQGQCSPCNWELN